MTAPVNSLPGELTLSTVNAALDAHATVAAQLDLAQVSRADSAGIALLLELTRRAKAQGGAVQFTGANAQVRGLAGFFGVDSVLNFQ